MNAGLFGEIKQDRAGFKNRDRRAAPLRVTIDDGRDAIVWRYGQKLRLELLARA